MLSNTIITDGVKSIVYPERNYNILCIGVSNSNAAAMASEIISQSRSFNLIGYVIAENSDANGNVSDTEPDANAGVYPFNTLKRFTWAELESGTKSDKSYTFTSDGTQYRIDGVIVETGIQFKNSSVTRALNTFEVPMHIDEPTSPEDDFVAFAEEMKAKSIPFQLGYVLRDTPSAFIIKRLIDKGYIGKINRIETKYTTDLSDSSRSELRGYYSDAAMFMYGSHMLDFIFSVMGMPMSMRTFKTETNAATHSLAPNPLVVTYDNGFAVLRYADCIVTIDANQIDANGYGDRCVAICGDKAKIVLSPLEGSSEIKYYPRNETDTYNDQKTYKSINILAPDYSLIDANDTEKYKYEEGRYTYLARNLCFMINNYKAASNEEKYEYLFDVDYNYEIKLHRLLEEVCD